MASPLLLTILVPTFHRPEGVKLLLQSVVRQRNFLGDSEILIINNAPEDQELISQICAEFSSQGLPVQALLQPIKGVSHARNLGIEKALGKWLVFFDDDEELEENYLSNLLALLSKSEENTILGGPYEAVFDGSKPIWIKNQYFNINFGPETRQLESGKYLLPFRERKTFPYHEQFVVEKILPAYFKFWFNYNLFRIK
jgi:glycosyltransferase involved in cell wall biosynthesis